MANQIVNPTMWIRGRIGEVLPVRPPVLYVAHPVEAQRGEVLATCCECSASWTFQRGDVVDLRLVCGHDDPVRQSTDRDAIVAFNLARAVRWWNWFHHGLPEATWIMPWYVNVLANGNRDPQLIERGLRDDCEVVKRSDAVMLCGPIVRQGGGMELEATTAAKHGLDVFQVDGINKEPSRVHAPASVPWRQWRP